MVSEQNRTTVQSSTTPFVESSFGHFRRTLSGGTRVPIYKKSGGWVMGYGDSTIICDLLQPPCTLLGTEVCRLPIEATAPSPFWQCGKHTLGGAEHMKSYSYQQVFK